MVKLMYGMFLNSVRLFFKGKLFRDNGAVFRQWLIGFVTTLLLFVALAWLVSQLFGAAVAGLLGGALQTWLFKDLKYA